MHHRDSNPGKGLLWVALKPQREDELSSVIFLDCPLRKILDRKKIIKWNSADIPNRHGVPVSGLSSVTCDMMSSGLFSFMLCLLLIWESQTPDLLPKSYLIALMTLRLSLPSTALSNTAPGTCADLPGYDTLSSDVPILHITCDNIHPPVYLRPSLD